ncbi:MAG: OsmC family protein [Gaiellaceae bacterium]
MPQTSVHVRTAHDASFAIGWAGKHALTIDRPEHEAGSGLGFNGGDLMLLALGASYANGLQRVAAERGIVILGLRVVVDCDWGGDPVRAQNVRVCARLEADAPEGELMELLQRAHESSEVKASLTLGTPIELADIEGICLEVETTA